MKKRILALGLSLALALSGCSAMLERDYQSITPHDRLPVAADDSNAVWVETYSELLAAILAQVTAHQETGVVRLRNWTDVENSLIRACEEVSHDDPLGNYAIDRIQHEYTHVVTYYEATITIDYRRSAEQIAAVTTVTGSGAIRAELRDALSGFVTETAFRVNYFDPTQDADYIRRLIRQAYYDIPASALGMPKTEVTLYPDSGQQRIVEVVLAYPEDPETLRVKRTQLEEAAQRLVEPYRAGLRDTVLIPALFSALRDRTAPADGEEQAPAVPSGSTAYAALVEGSADSEGMALAYQLLCGLMEIDCTLAEGELNGEHRFWTIVAVENGYRHVDPSRPDGLLLTDAQMAEAGFTWDESYPLCGEAAPDKIVEEN